MSKFEKQLLNSAQEGANGSGNSVGAHLLSKLAKGNADPKLVNEEIREKIVRGGIGSKGEPEDIRKSIDNARKGEVQIDQDLAKIKNDKEGLLFAIADLRIKERQAVEKKLSSFTIEKIRKELAEAQGRIEKINGVLPESEATKDHKQIQSIMSDWYGGKRDWKKENERFKKAEKILEREPRNTNALREANSARVEMKETEELLKKTAEEAKSLAENTKSNSVRNEGIHHTNEETIEERNFLNHRRGERVAPGIFGHKEENEEMQRKMDELADVASETPAQQKGEPFIINETSVEEKNMRQELPPLEFTLNPKEEQGDLARVENRIKDVSARQAKLEEEIKDPFQNSAVGEEIAELEKEMASLEERRKGIEAKKPLQSAYDMAMDRIWKENEEKRNAMLGETPESDLEHNAEAHNAILPIQIEEEVDVVGVPREGQESAFEKFENIAEEKSVSKERALSMIASMRENVEAEAEKKKVPKEWIRRVGDTWNRIPTRYKLLISVGMLATGFAVETAATTATIAAVGAGLRFIGGTGLYATFDGMFEKRSKKNGVERSGMTKARHKFTSAGLAIIIAGILPNMARDYAVEHGFFQKISELFGFGSAQVEAPVKTATYVETAKAGDSIWKMSEHQLEAHYGEKFTSLSPEKQTYLIDAVKDKITLGMSEEAANTLAVGQSMDFKHVFTDKDFMNGMFTNAQNITSEQITNIKNYDPSLSVETPAHEVSADEFLNEPLHTTFTPKEADAVVPPQVTLTPEQTIPTPETQPKDFLMEGFTNETPEKSSPTSFIQPEILPGNITEFAQIEAGADAILHDDIDLLFGESKFLGFGHIDGTNSINWKDPQIGFSVKTVTEIMSTNPGTLPVDGGKTFGIENYEATNKMKEYLRSVASMSGVHHNSNENVVDYIHRASIVRLSK